MEGGSAACRYSVAMTGCGLPRCRAAGDDGFIRGGSGGRDCRVAALLAMTVSSRSLVCGVGLVFVEAERHVGDAGWVLHGGEAGGGEPGEAFQ